MKNILVMLALPALLYTSCSKENTKSPNITTCVGSALSDSISAYQKIIGIWKLEQEYCSGLADSKSVTLDKVVIATFHANTTVTVTEDSKVVFEGPWRVVHVQSGYGATLQTTDFVPYLGGFLTFCQEDLVSDLMPVDGCKQLYVKQPF